MITIFLPAPLCWGWRTKSPEVILLERMVFVGVSCTSLFLIQKALQEVKQLFPNSTSAVVTIRRTFLFSDITDSSEEFNSILKTFFSHVPME